MGDDGQAPTEFSVEQYRALIEQTSDVITVVGANGAIQYQSPSSEPVKGWEPEELVGEQILEYVHPDDRSRVAEEFSALTVENGRLDEEIEFRFQSKDDGWIWLAVTGTAPGPDSPIDGYITTSRDITERKEFEQELASERDFLETILESLPYPFYVLDVEDYSVIHANSHATVERGDTCYEVTHGRDEPCDQGADTAPCPINEVAVDEPVTVKHIHEDEEGNERVYELHAAPITDEDGNVSRIAESNIDITERVEYERQLESQRDRLELLNQIVRHDIRNDIQIISSYAEALGAYTEDDGQEYLEKILAASNDAVEITETARDITEVMMGTDGDLSTMNLRSVLRSEIDTIHSSYDRAVVTVDGSIPAVDVCADDMLEAVFRNLLSNAVQHNDKEIPEITVSTATGDGSAQVEIADNGPGVPDDRKEEIFEEGEQDLHSTGTGLGLYLVKTVIDRYDGTVTVVDNEPTGAVFTVTLPVAD